MITGKFKSSNGVNDVYYYIYGEEIKNPKAVVQISHGMIDYINRFSDLIKFLNKNDIVVCGCDDLGHGRTGSESLFGYFADSKGSYHVLNDLYTTTKIVKQKYSDIPFFMLGHSMGSFFARAYAYEHSSELKGLIILGTSGRVYGLSFGLFLLDIMMFLSGKKCYIKALESLTKKPYFKYIPHPKNYREWITRNEEKLNSYISDPKCSFTFSLSAYYDMISTLKFVSSNKWYNNLNKDLPIFIASGTHDPIGNYGKGVLEVYNRLKNKQNDIKLKLYPNAFHELHNELPETTQEFFNDTLTWLEDHISN